MGGNKIAPNPTLVGDLSRRLPRHGPDRRERRQEWQVSREEQDAFALRSHQRALAAIDAGRFDGRDRPAAREVHLRGRRRRACGRRRPSSTPTKARAATPRWRRWRSCGRSSHAKRHRHRRQLVADERRRGGGARHASARRGVARPDAAGALRRLRHRRRAAGAHRHRPGAAIPKALKLAGLTLDRHRPDRAERSLRRAGARRDQATLGIDPEKVNVNGGAIALGHPLGAPARS